MANKPNSFFGLNLSVINLILLAAIVAAPFAVTRGAEVVFLPVTGESVNDLLVPLILIGLFIERAVEVLVSSWRGFGRSKVEYDIDVAEKAGNSAKVVTLKATLFDYRTETKRFAFKCAAALGLFVAIAGVRVLEPLTDIELAADLWERVESPRKLQVFFFHAVDITLTTGLLAGGANGIHKVLSLFLDFVDSSKERLKQREKIQPSE